MAQKTNPETIIQSAIMDELDRLNVFYFRCPTSNVRVVNGQAKFLQSHTPGLPDIMVITPDGKFWGIEVKTSTGKLSDSQKDVREALEANGARFIVARSLDDLKELREALRDLPKPFPNRVRGLDSARKAKRLEKATVSKVTTKAEWKSWFR